MIALSYVRTVKNIWMTYDSTFFVCYNLFSLYVIFVLKENIYFFLASSNRECVFYPIINLYEIFDEYFNNYERHIIAIA